MPRVNVYSRFGHADEAFLTRLVRDCVGGEKRVKDQGELYLPRPTGMATQAYQGFRQRAPFLSVPRHTLDLMMGKVFRKDTIFTGLDHLRGRLPFVDHGQYDLQWGARRIMREVLSVGRVGLLLDLDPQGKNEVNIVVVESEGILEVNAVGNMIVEAHLSLDDCEDDEYWRLYLDEGVYTIEKIGVDGNAMSDPIAPAAFGQTLPFIPLTIINPTNFDPICPVRPPMADLSQKTLYHYQLGAEYRQALHYVASPQPFVAGFRPDEVPTEISPSKIWAAQNHQAKAQLVTFTGEGLSEVRAALEMTKLELASMGASMLLPKVTGVQAARTLELKDQEESSFVVEVAENVSDGLERVLRMLAVWELPVTGVLDQISVKINTDVVSAKIDASTLTALHRAVMSGHLSWESWVDNLKRGEIIPADRSAADELDMTQELGGVPSNGTT